MRQGSPLAAIVPNMILKSNILRSAAYQLSRSILRIVVVAIIALLAIVRQMMIAVLGVGCIAITKICGTTQLALVAVAVRVALMGMKVSQGFGFAAFVAALEVWYSGHIGLLTRLVMLPATDNSAGASCCVNYSTGAR